MTIEPRRGELWTVAGGAGNPTSKPRPVLIITSDVFSELDYVTVLLVTTDSTEAFTRIPLAANRQTGLAEPSMIQADKIVTVHRRNLRQRCGYVTPTVLAKVRETVSAYLGFGG
ncbi:type II toxin-antitoxin system PemK/MazF family toxin [Microbacterium protaetiae]|uniref:type II toxin-antitoxin system PemK/MazF family toxin n=1 Tax=Microbacterium protaetiae TaxID=2509458 RepID=UPI001A9264B7|nr:type II toxin-antitoxin system PemK/MazF family toxin [Microbacterium protaetiae]